MPKTKNETRKRPTNFEQVPLEVVKKIAEEDAPNHTTATDEASADPTPAKTTARSVPGRTPDRNGR